MASDARTLRRASLRAARTLRSPREGGEWPTVCRSLETAGREVLGCEHVALLLYDRALHALHGWRGDEELRVDMDPLRDVLDALADLELPRARSGGSAPDATMRLCLPLLAPAADPEDDSRGRHGFAGDSGRQLVGALYAQLPNPGDAAADAGEGRAITTGGGGGNISEIVQRVAEGHVLLAFELRALRRRDALVATAAALAAEVGQHLHVFVAQRERHARLERLAASASTLALGGAVGTLGMAMHESVAAHSVAVLTRDDSREVLARWATAPPGKRTGTARARLAGMEPLSSGSVAAYVAKAGRIVSQADGVSSMMCVPVALPTRRGGAPELLGAVQLRGARSSYAFSAHDEHRALAAAGGGAPAIQHALELHALLREGTLADAALRPLLRLRFAKQRAPVVRVLRGVARSLLGARRATVWGVELRDNAMWVEAGAAEPLERPEHACAAHAAASGHFSTEVRGGTEGGGLSKLAVPLSLAGRGAVADCTTPLGVLELLTPPAGSGDAGGSSAGEDWRRPEVHALTALADGGALSLHSSAEYRRLQQPVIQMSAFVGELELHKATATIVGACVAACAAESGSLWLLQDGRKAEGRRAPPRQLLLLPLRQAALPAADGVLGRCMATRRAVTLAPPLEPGALPPRLARHAASSGGGPPRSAMAMPLLTHDGEPVGAMLLVNKRGGGGGFGADDEVALARLATEAAATLRHATQIHARYTHASAIYSQIFGIAGQLQRSARAALAVVGVEVQLRVPCMQLAVLQLAPEGSGRALRAAYATEQLALSEETYDFALRARRPINTAKDQPREEGWPLDLYSAPSTLLVPFCSVNGAPLGMLQLVDRQGAPYFDDADVALVASYAAACGLAASLHLAREEAEREREREREAGAAPAAGGGTEASGRCSAGARKRVGPNRHSIRL